MAHVVHQYPKYRNIIDNVAPFFLKDAKESLDRRTDHIGCLTREAEETRRELSSIRDRASRLSDNPRCPKGMADILWETEGRLAMVAKRLKSYKESRIRASLNYDIVGQTMKHVATGDVEGAGSLQKSLADVNGWAIGFRSRVSPCTWRGNSELVSPVIWP